MNINNEEENIKPLQFDKRVIGRFVSNDKCINSLDFEEHLTSLPDLQNSCENITTKNYVEKKRNISG